jgi:two-component system, NtrC family, sensor kinase
VLTLLVLQGPDKGRRYELPDNVTLIGRESRQMLITDDTVSRRHCELIPEGNSWILHDLGSINGTYVNGTRTGNRYELKLGDQIRVGRTLLVFGAQPGISRSAGMVKLSGAEAGMDSSIMHTMPSPDDSMVLAVPEPAAAAMANLKILYQLGATLGSTISINQLVEIVMDLVFENVKADRGLILLLNSNSGELQPVVVRTRDEARGVEKGDPNEEKIHASRTIINHVLTTAEGVLSSNAMTDQRFSKGKSVHDLGIRSALCVPIKAPRFEGSQDAITGVIYVDSSVRNYTYSPEQLRLLSAIGMQAGLAIQNFKLYQAQIKAERMTAVGETTAALSHSIKNILQALHGGADVVEMGFKSGNIVQATKGWQIVARNLNRIYGLTMNLLAYSKDREPRLQTVNPNTIAQECVELIAQTANEKGVMVVADLDKDHPPIPLDPDGMHQVLMNLLSNAFDAVEPEEGVIRVVTRFDPQESQSTIEVADNGTGISPNVLPHMFELFHSTKGNRGTGLGLAVARKIVEEHDGTISVQSQEGDGSTFTIRLPVSKTSEGGPSDTQTPK